MIPPGLHFVYYSSVNVKGTVCPTGFSDPDPSLQGIKTPGSELDLLVMTQIFDKT